MVIPGGTFGPSVPQLFLPAVAAMRRGARPVMLEWRDVEEVDGLTAEGRPRWVQEQAAPSLTPADPTSTLVLAKSLGTYAAPLVADIGLPAIWVTPLLTEPVVVAALREASAPFLLVGGTADDWWDGDVARSLTAHVLELLGADHGLFLPGPLRRSTENLGMLVETCEAFVDEVVWPQRARPR